MRCATCANLLTIQVQRLDDEVIAVYSTRLIQVLHTLKSSAIRFKTTLNYWMMVERYPNLKEKVGSSNPSYEISFLLDKKLVRWSTASCALIWRWHVGLLSQKRGRSSAILCTIPLDVSPFHFQRFGWANNSSIWLVVVVVSSNIRPRGKVLLTDPSSTIQLSKLTNVKILHVCSSSF